MRTSVTHARGLLLYACVGLCLGTTLGLYSGVRAASSSPPVGPGAASIRYMDVPPEQAASMVSRGSILSERAAIAATPQSRSGLALGSEVAVSARLVRLSNDSYAQVDPNSRVPIRCYIQNRLVWLVTYSGLQLPAHGPSSGRVNHELNVVIDAATGECLEMFSYR